jgi:hypothetical protein
MNLLFPFYNRQTKLLLQQQGKTFYGLGLCGRGPAPFELDGGGYRHWHARLRDLVAFFNDPPRSWWQVAMDRRDKIQYATFWTAVLVLWLSVVSILFGVVACVYTIKQYRLALAQACVVPGAAAQLPQYCR